MIVFFSVNSVWSVDILNLPLKLWGFLFIAVDILQIFIYVLLVVKVN